METPLKPGDWLIYKNNQLMAFAKPAGIAVQNDKTGDKSLLNLAEIYAKSKLELIHRLDRPASGIILFAKNKKALANLNKQFQDRTVKKTYLAVVKKPGPEKDGELIHFLKKNGKQNKSYICEPETTNAQKAILKYRLLGSSENYTLLELDLETGRHHQIRAQLGAIGFPVKGDVKYGFRRANKDRSIHLHAWKLSFRHPVSKELVELKQSPPQDAVWDAFGDILG